METFWLFKQSSKDVKIPYDKFPKDEVKIFMKINYHLKLNNPNWELHKIDDDGNETILSNYKLTTTTSMDFYDSP